MKESETVLKAMKKAGKPLKASDIAELANLDKKLVDKAIKQLKDENKIISPQRCFYIAK